MQNKLTVERIEQMEKMLCEEQVAKNDGYNELFQLLGAARSGLMQQGDMNKDVAGTDTPGNSKPFGTCASYRSLVLGGKCKNCGMPQCSHEPKHIVEYTLEEGGIWIAISKNNPYPPSYCFAIKHNDGEILDKAFDKINLRPRGWQPPETKEQSDDVRVVPRGLLENCLTVLEEIKLSSKAEIFDVKLETDTNFAINKLKAALSIEANKHVVL